MWWVEFGVLCSSLYLVSPISIDVWTGWRLIKSYISNTSSPLPSLPPSSPPHPSCQVTNDAIACSVCSAALPRPSSPPPPLPPVGILEACIWSARTESPVSLSVSTSDSHVTGSPFPSSHSCKILGIILSDFPRHSSSMALTRLPALSLRRKIPNVK